MRYFRLAIIVVLLIFAAGCSDDSSSDDPISEPDVTREADDVIDE